MLRIAFIGATGHLGAPVARALAAAGHHLTCLVRTPEKAGRLLPAGADIVRGDLRHAADVAALVRGQDCLYLNLSVKPDSKESDWQAEREGLLTALDAARAAGIKRVGYLASLIIDHQGRDGFDWWVFRLKHAAVQAVQRSGIPSTIFRPSNFMDNFATGNYRRGHRLLLAGTSRQPMWFVAAADYGRQVARALESDSANQDYVIQGPEPFTADQAAEVYRAHYPHARLRIARMPLGVLRFLGLFSRPLHYGARIVEALNEYPEPFGAEGTWQRLGKPTTTLADFARQAP